MTESRASVTLDSWLKKMSSSGSEGMNFCSWDSIVRSRAGHKLLQTRPSGRKEQQGSSNKIPLRTVKFKYWECMSVSKFAGHGTVCT